MQQLQHSFDIRRWCGLALVAATILGLRLLPDTPPAVAATVTLYDGALGGTPDTQGFSYLTEPIVSAQASQSFANGTTTLTTTLQISDKAGYFAKNERMPQLDRTAGYTVRFATQVLEENHSNNNRAGFSVIVLSSDLRGIELGFWEDQVWAQADSPPFTHAETRMLDTTAGLIAYELRILGNSYTLTGGGATLSGPLRDYSAEGPPYTLANFLFLGDDTTSASARIRLTKVDVVTGGAPTATATGTARSLYLPAVVRPTAGASR
ncbi:MAG TPA: hypothetical protein VFO07_11180 [Roseiflexaceae bacterium]|nr:hypothetical protein [Roseiflexaceae bacterium]